MFAKKKITVAAIIIAVIVLSGSPQAQEADTLWINYQGILTDSNGDPLPAGTYTVDFRFYEDSTNAEPLWEQSIDIQINEDSEGLINGLIHYELNNYVPGDIEMSFEDELPWMGVCVEGEEILPRTRITSAPHAFISRRMYGDIKTRPGIMVLPNTDGDSATVYQAGDLQTSVSMAYIDGSENPYEYEKDIEFLAEAGSNAIQLHRPEPCVPPNSCTPAFEASVTDSLTALTLTTRPSDPTEPTIETVIEAGEQEVDFDIVVSVPGEDDVTPVSIGTNIADGSSHMVLSTPSGEAILELKTDEFSGNPGVTIKSEVDGLLRSGDERLELDEDGFIMEASSWDESTGDSSWTFVAADTAGGKAEIAQKDGSGDSTVVAMQANDSISQIGLISQLSGNRSTVDLGASTSEAGIIIVNTRPSGGSSVINMQTTSDQTELRLSNGDGADDFSIALRTTSTDASIGIGTVDPSDELYVVGDITATGAITELSSLKYKTNINQISGALDKISGLRGVHFDWRSDEYPELKLSSDQQVGLIAEEVERVIPQLVHSSDNGEMSVDYSKLTAVLIEAIKEQQRQIEVLSRRVEELENTSTPN